MGRPSARWSRLALAAGLGAVIVGLAAAAASGKTSATPRPGGSLVFATDVDPGCLDPHVSAADVVAVIDRNVFDSLVYQDASGKLHPWLATSWKVSPDLETFTFNLRPGVKFQDGTPLTAQVVKENFDHIAAPSTKSQYAVNLLGPYYKGTTATGKLTVRVAFSKPFAPFLQAASTAYLGIESGKAIETNAAGLCSKPVGSGPFSFVSYAPNQQLVLKKNPAYDWAPAQLHHEGPAYLNQVTFRILPVDAVRLGALTSGQVDAIADVPPGQVSSLKSKGLQFFRSDAPGGNYNLYLNTQRAPFNSLPVRQAFQRSIDLNTLVKTLYFGQYQRAWSPIGPTTVGYDKSTEGSWPYSVDAANKLLDQAGYTQKTSGGIREKNGQPLVVKWLSISGYTPREQRGSLDQLIQAQAKKVGIDVEITPEAIGDYLNDYSSGKYDIVDFSFVRDDPDVLRLFFSSDTRSSPGHISQNESLLANPQVDGWLNQGAATLDPTARARAYAKVQEFVLKNAVVVPTYVPAYLVGASKKVQGLDWDPAAFPIFYDAWLSS